MEKTWSMEHGSMEGFAVSHRHLNFILRDWGITGDLKMDQHTIFALVESGWIIGLLAKAGGPVGNLGLL